MAYPPPMVSAEIEKKVGTATGPILTPDISGTYEVKKK
jgi:hypothetical protein